MLIVLNSLFSPLLSNVRNGNIPSSAKPPPPPNGVAVALRHWVWKITLYLRNDTRYCHSYYRMRIKNRNQGFEWPVTSSPDFKVTIYSTSNNSKMVQHRVQHTGTTYRGRPIVSRIWFIERRHFNDLDLPPTEHHAIIWCWMSQQRYENKHTVK